MPAGTKTSEQAFGQLSAARDYFDRHVEGVLAPCFPEILADGLVLWGGVAPLARLDEHCECRGWVTHPTLNRARRLCELNAVLAGHLPAAEWMPGRPIRFEAIAPGQAGVISEQATLEDLDRQAMWRLMQCRPLHDPIGYVAQMYEWFSELPTGVWGRWCRQVWGEQLACHQRYLQAQQRGNLLQQTIAAAGFAEAMLENAFLLSQVLAPGSDWLAIEAADADDHRREAWEQMLLLSRQPTRLADARPALDNALGVFGCAKEDAETVPLRRWRHWCAPSSVDQQPAWCWYAMSETHAAWRLHVSREDELGAFLAMGRWLFWSRALARCLQAADESAPSAKGTVDCFGLGSYVNQALAQRDWRARCSYAQTVIDRQIAPALTKSRRIDGRFLSSPGEVVGDALAAAAREDRFWP